MVVELLRTDVIPGEANLSKENETVAEINSEQAVEKPIKSNLVDNSHDETGPAEAENLPEDVVDDGSAGKQIHNIYFVRFRPYEDPKLKAKLEEVDQDIFWKNQFRFQIIQALRAKRPERAKLISQLTSFTNGSSLQKGAINDQLIGRDMDVVRKHQQTVSTKIEHTEKELKSITDEIASLEEQLDILSNKRFEAYKTSNDLRKLEDEMNALFYQNCSVLNIARDLAAKKNIQALKKLSSSEGEKFMAQYSSSKTFRDDYNRRILLSLDRRQLSRDGRQRNPNEKTIVGHQTQNELETTSTKITPLPAEISLASLHDTVSTHKVQDEIPKPTKFEQKENADRQENINDSEIGESKELLKPNEINAAMLKEMKREEEIAKAKFAKERKRKLAEKAEAKAVAWAQKEAEKKIKEKKKHATMAEPSEINTISVEQREAEKKVEAPLLGTKEKREKVRYKGRTKAPALIPKAIVKRKRSPSYWSWVVRAAVILALGFILYLAITDNDYKAVRRSNVRNHFAV